MAASARRSRWRVGAGRSPATGWPGAAWVVLVGALLPGRRDARRAARPRQRSPLDGAGRDGARRPRRRCALTRDVRAPRAPAVAEAAARGQRAAGAQRRPRRPRRCDGGEAAATLRADAAAARRGRDPAHLGALARAVRPGLEADRRDAEARSSPITPNIAAVKDEAIRLFARDAMFGLKAQLETGDGSEFHALREFAPGMDRRTIDWKQSARHGKLLAKEFRTERNHPVIFAIDTGRLMCEPLLGAPRIDRAINAALLDGVRLAEARRPGRALRLRRQAAAVHRRRSPARTPSRSCSALAARLDYSTEETNYTLGLTQLGAALERRSLIVVFTDFADTTSAELMLENVARLMQRHLVLFVVFRDEELEAIARREPVDAGGRLARRDRRGAAARARRGRSPGCAGMGVAHRRRARPTRIGPGAAQPPTSTSSGGICCEAPPWPSLQLKSQRFRAEREARLAAAGGAAGRAESGSAAALSDEDLLALPVLYRSGAVVAVGGAGDLARPQPDRLSGEPLHPRLLLRLRRPRGPRRAAGAVLRTRPGRPP